MCGRKKGRKEVRDGRGRGGGSAGGRERDRITYLDVAKHHITLVVSTQHNNVRAVGKKDYFNSCN